MIKIICIPDNAVDIHSDTESEIIFVTKVALVHPEINAQEVSTFDCEDFYFESDHKANHWEIQWCLEGDEDDPHGSYPLAHKIYSFIKDFGMDVEIIKENIDKHLQPCILSTSRNER